MNLDSVLALILFITWFRYCSGETEELGSQQPRGTYNPALANQRDFPGHLACYISSFNSEHMD